MPARFSGPWTRRRPWLRPRFSTSRSRKSGGGFDTGSRFLLGLGGARERAVVVVSDFLLQIGIGNGNISLRMFARRGPRLNCRLGSRRQPMIHFATWSLDYPFPLVNKGPTASGGEPLPHTSDACIRRYPNKIGENLIPYYSHLQFPPCAYPIPPPSQPCNAGMGSPSHPTHVSHTPCPEQIVYTPLVQPSQPSTIDPGTT